MCRSRRELSNEYLLAKIGVDTAENEPLEVCGKIIQYYSFVSLEVIAVDTDAALTDELRQRAATAGFQNLTAYQGDALRMAYPRFDLCVANLPFQISSPFLAKLVSQRATWRAATRASRGRATRSGRAGSRRRGRSAGTPSGGRRPGRRSNSGSRPLPRAAEARR